MKLFDKIKKAVQGQPAPKAAAHKTSQPQKRETYVFVAARGKKFHYDPCCPSILNAFNSGKAIQMDLSKARAAGYTACDKCCYDYLHD